MRCQYPEENATMRLIAGTSQILLKKRELAEMPVDVFWTFAICFGERRKKIVMDSIISIERGNQHTSKINSFRRKCFWKCPPAKRYFLLSLNLIGKSIGMFYPKIFQNSFIFFGENMRIVSSIFASCSSVAETYKNLFFRKVESAIAFMVSRRTSTDSLYIGTRMR